MGKKRSIISSAKVSCFVGEEGFAPDTPMPIRIKVVKVPVSEEEQALIEARLKRCVQDIVAKLTLEDVERHLANRDHS